MSPPSKMRILKDEEIKIRVPAALKQALEQLARPRLMSLSQISREAMLEYLQRRQIAVRTRPGRHRRAA